VDPSDGTFWAANEYATSTSGGQSTNWGTAIAHFQLGSSTNTQPITVSASAALNSDNKSAALSATATDPNSGATITGYTWSVLSEPSGAKTPTFSINASNAAYNTTATFYQAGTYTFQVAVTDSLGATGTATVNVTVQQTLTSLSISPSSVSLKDGSSQTFTATTLDQFGHPMATQPTTSFRWTKSGGGTLAPSTTNTDTYTAPSSGKGTTTITVTYNGLSAKATVKYSSKFALSTQIAAATTSSSTTLITRTAAAGNYGGPSSGEAAFSLADGIFIQIGTTTASDAPPTLSSIVAVSPRFDALLSMGAGARTMDVPKNSAAHDTLDTDPSL